MLEDNPYGLLRYEGDPLPTLCSLDGGEYVIYLGTFSKILSPGLRLGWRAAPRPVLEQAQPRQAGRRPLLVPVRPALRRRRTSRERDWRTYVRTLSSSTGAGATRCSTRWPSTCPPRPSWTRPGGGLFIWATLPDYIDTTDLLARALRENVAFVPGRAAFLDGRGGSSMRLNFSGVGEDDIREGVRADRQGRPRAGRPVRHADRHAPGAPRREAAPAEAAGRARPPPCTTCGPGAHASDAPGRPRARRGQHPRARARMTASPGPSKR